MTWSWPGTYFLKLYKTNPLRLCAQAVCWRVPAQVSRLQSAKGAALRQPWEEKLWPPASRPELKQPCSLPQAMRKGRETKYLGNWVLKILSLGGANSSPCKTPPRYTFSKGYTVSAKREDKGPVPPSPGGRARGRQGPGCHTLRSGFYAPQRLKPFLDTAYMCLLANKHVLSLSSEHKYAGSTWASSWLRSLPVLLWEEQGAWEGDADLPLPWYCSTSCQS